MTEEILKAAIIRLRSKATERYALIKDLYHRPSTTETVDMIVQHAVALAQLEGGMLTLQQYSASLAEQTDAEAKSNEPEEVTEVEVEEDSELEDEETEDDDSETDKEEGEKSKIGHEELMKRSATYRKSMKNKKKG